MKRIHLYITKADIEHGRAKAGHCKHCAIGLSLARRGFDNFRVWFDEIIINGRTYEIPKKATTFQHQLCSGRKVRPFSFTAVRED